MLHELPTSAQPAQPLPGPSYHDVASVLGLIESGASSRVSNSAASPFLVENALPAVNLSNVVHTTNSSRCAQHANQLEISALAVVGCTVPYELRVDLIFRPRSSWLTCPSPPQDSSMLQEYYSQQLQAPQYQATGEMWLGVAQHSQADLLGLT